MCDKWFSKAKYGLFIHWGLYAMMGGIYQGEEVPYGAEWIMKNARIPLGEYRKNQERFNPKKFDAEKWVKYAAGWGMKYLVFTAKHHDGFAMYDTKVSDYNVMNTPFGRDVVRELSIACEKYGIVFCLYYSQMQDWEDENGWGNDWDFQENEKKDFEKYFREKVKPQVKELLTCYAKIGLIWFDTPYTMPEIFCRELKDWVKKWQPDCLINGRIGYGLGDYRQMSDNEIPVLAFHGLWETPVTLNDTWGYSSVDQNWKTPKEILGKLVDAVGKGGNLLLNIGPDGIGNIPEGSVAVLEEVGRWIEKNGESVYGTEPVPDFPYQIRWGKLTMRPGKLYLHVFQYPRFPYEIMLAELKTRVNKVYILDSGKELEFYQSYEPGRDEYRFRIILPEKCEDSLDLVVCAELDGPVKVHGLENFSCYENGGS